MPGLVRERAVEADDVGRLEQLVERKSLVWRPGGEAGARVDDPHVERLGQARNLPADATEADDTQRSSGEPVAEHERRRPEPRRSRPDEAVALADPAQEVEHERDR